MNINFLMNDIRYREAKSLGFLYHYTVADSLLSILKKGLRGTDYINSQRGLKDRRYVSFTRNSLLHKTYFWDKTEARLIVNGEALSENYKIESYLDSGQGVKRQSLSVDKETYSEENEERVVLPLKQVFLDVKPFLLKIEILFNTDEEEIADIDDMNDPNYETHQEYIKNSINSIYPSIKCEIVDRFESRPKL